MKKKKIDNIYMKMARPSLIKLKKINQHRIKWFFFVSNDPL